MNRFFSLSALMLCLGLAGCVGSGGIDGINSARAAEQQVEVHAILDHREVAGVGCLLENDAGRWFVLAPGRVTVTRSSQPLAVSCKREGVGSADESWNAHHQSGPLVGKILFSAGLRNYLQDGYAYATVLTVDMRPARTGEGGADPGTPVY
ncbi:MULTISPECIES: hypothetical protein [unclassified Massilia]|uniref:hypothetical protein n=1 Tax=unclassified Massilia TaxID=2609279 RepID=UPI001E566244|nr:MULTISPECIES: hypothetical protein [unclassified Massilia]